MDKYCLNQNFAIREEFFGCLCFNPKIERFYQFNKDAFRIIRHFRSPITINDLQIKLQEAQEVISKEVLDCFLADLERKEIITKDILNESTAFLYTDFSEGQVIPDNYLVAPTGCTIYVTEFCSKRCLHCIVRSGPNVSQAFDFTVDEWRPVFKRLRAWGVISLIFTGGEPLLKKDIFDILRAADDLGFDICLLTDYDGINQTHISRLKEIKHLNYIQVSLDGASAETHDLLRGKGSFEKSIKRIKLYVGNDFDITVSSVIHKKNIHEVVELAQLSKNMGVKYLYLNPLAPYGRAKEILTDWSLDSAELRRLGYIYYYAIRVVGISSGNPFWENLNPEDVLKDDFFPFELIPQVMSSAIFQLSINSRGDCYLDSKMKSEDLLKLGNVLTDDFEQMWHSKRLTPLRKMFVPGQSAFIHHDKLLQLINN